MKNIMCFHNSNPEIFVIYFIKEQKGLMNIMCINLRNRINQIFEIEKSILSNLDFLILAYSKSKIFGNKIVN